MDETNKDIEDKITKLFNKNNKIYNLSIIILYDDNNININKLLYSILNQNYIHYLNLELVIIDNGTNSFFNTFYNNKLLKKLFLNKNINIKIINLYEKKLKSIALNIGIKYSSNDLITFCDFNNVMFKNRLIYQCLLDNDNVKNINKIIYNKSNQNENYKYFSNKDYILDIFDNNILTSSNNIFFNKKNINYIFPINDLLDTDEKMSIIFIIINFLNNVFVEFNNNKLGINLNITENDNQKINSIIKKKILDEIDYRILPENIMSNNLENIFFEKISKSILKNFYSNKVDYLDFISDIYNI